MKVEIKNGSMYTVNPAGASPMSSFATGYAASPPRMPVPSASAAQVGASLPVKRKISPQHTDHASRESKQTSDAEQITDQTCTERDSDTPPRTEDDGGKYIDHMLDGSAFASGNRDADQTSGNGSCGQNSGNGKFLG